MIESDVKVLADGSVVGTFPYVEGFTGFSNNSDEQSGHYFPFSLTKTGNNMTFKKNGVTKKSEIPYEKNNVFRVENSDTFEVDVDGEKVVTFSFKKATMKPKAAQVSIAARTETTLISAEVKEQAQKQSIETKLTQDELSNMTVAEIRSLAAQNGYKITATKKADVVSQYLEQQK